MKTTFPILLSANYSFGESLVAAVKSILQSTPTPELLAFHIVDRGLPAASLHLLDAYARIYGSEVIIENPSEERLRGLGVPPQFFLLGGAGHYDRLLAPFLISSAKCLYLDSDLFVQRDIREVMESDLEGAAIAAVQDDIIPVVRGGCGVVDWEARNMNPETPYFNSGVLLFDLSQWRERDLSLECMEVALQYESTFHHPPPLLDQYTLNVVFYQKWKQLDRRWNRITHLINPGDPDPFLVHFAGKVKAFSTSPDSNRSLRYYSRMCQRLIRDDWTEARKLSEEFQNQSRLYGQDDWSRCVLRTPGNSSFKTVHPGLLAVPPDTGDTVMIMPVLMRNSDTYRFRNFCFLVKAYAVALPHLVVVEQLEPDRLSVVQIFLEELGAPSVSYLACTITDEKIHKSKLINRGVHWAVQNCQVRYLWQMDADIYVNPLAVLLQLNALNSKALAVIRPLLWFIRLDQRTTNRVLSMGPEELSDFNPYDQVSDLTRIVDFFGPGTLIFSQTAFEASQGMDEQFTGWGWEDVDFARRLAQDHVVHTLPLRGIHLHHENDRVLMPGNFSKYVQGNDALRNEVTAEREFLFTKFVNVLQTFCLIHPSSPGPHRTLIASLQQADEVFLSQGPIHRQFLPRFPGLARHTFEQMVYSLARTECAASGFTWALGAEYLDPYTGNAIQESQLLEVLISHEMKVVLCEPDPGGAELKEMLSFDRLQRLIGSACQRHGIDFEDCFLLINPRSFIAFPDAVLETCANHLLGIRSTEQAPSGQTDSQRSL